MGKAFRRIVGALAVIALIVGGAWIVWPNPDAPKRDDLSFGEGVVGRHVSPTVPLAVQDDLNSLGYTTNKTHTEENGTISQTWTAPNRPTVTLNDHLSGIYQVESLDFGPAGAWENFTCEPGENTRLKGAINFGESLHDDAANSKIKLHDDRKRPGMKSIHWSNMDGTPLLTCYAPNS